MQVKVLKSVRYHALDIWRGIVCLVVVLEHAGVALWFDSLERIPGQSYWLRDSVVMSLRLNLGAPLFFVISGYCIAASMDSTRRKGISPLRFLARRLWRIFPPYWASMAIIAALVVFLDCIGLRWLHQTSIGLELFEPSSFSPSQWLGNFTLTETWRQTLWGGVEPKLLNRVAWALCYQEQFYLVCFAALLFLPNRLYGTLALATLAIVGFRIMLWDSSSERYFHGFFPDLWHEFAIGLALYWRINVARSFWAKRAVEVGFVGIFLVGVWFAAVTTAAAALFGSVLLVAYRWDEAIAGIKRFDLLRACGRRSYSIYLIHLPVCTVGNTALASLGLQDFWLRVFVMIPLVTAGSVVAGWVFYACVDRHFKNLPIVGRFSKWIKPPRPGVAIPHAQV